MIKVDQTIVNEENGDCTRACIASMLELPIDAVPNFIRFKNNWYLMMKDFLRRLNYDYTGTGYLNSKHSIELSESPNIKGFVMASVPSKTFPQNGIGHSVVINLNGVVVHDPNPNKLWQDVNVIKTNYLRSWALIEPINNYAHCSFSINEYDEDGDLVEKGIYLNFSDTKIKISDNKEGLTLFEKQISRIINEIKENY